MAGNWTYLWSYPRVLQIASLVASTVACGSNEPAAPPDNPGSSTGSSNTATTSGSGGSATTSSSSAASGGASASSTTTPTGGGTTSGSGGLNGTGGAGTGPASGGAGGTSNGGAATGGSGGTGGEPWDGVCPDAGGPAMVKLPDGFCIDSTEVTRAQYLEWLETDPDPGLVQQNDLCTDHASFEPEPECFASESACPSGEDCANHPMVCITYCDAYAYCQGVGKRLCGHVNGGRVLFEQTQDRTQSQWYTACTMGQAAQEDGCHAQKGFDVSTIEVGSLASCQTSAPGYEGIYDLSGNVYEFVDECDLSGPMPRCLARGGSYSSAYASCMTDSTQGVLGSIFFGFRCCAP